LRYVDLSSSDNSNFENTNDLSWISQGLGGEDDVNNKVISPPTSSTIEKVKELKKNNIPLKHNK